MRSCSQDGPHVLSLGVNDLSEMQAQNKPLHQRCLLLITKRSQVLGEAVSYLNKKTTLSVFHYFLVTYVSLLGLIDFLNSESHFFLSHGPRA